MADIFPSIPLINFFAYTFTKSRILNYGFLISFVVYTPIALFWISKGLLHIPAIGNCSTELSATMILLCLQTFLKNFAGIHYLLNGSNLEMILTKINVVIEGLHLTFRTKISLYWHRRVAKSSMIVSTVIALHIMFVHLFDVIFDPDQLKIRSAIMLIVLVTGDILTALQTVWIFLFTLAQLILISILISQIQAMIPVNRKWHYRYALQYLNIFEQSSIVNDVFGIVTLVAISSSFGNMVLTSWNVLQPDASCFGEFRYMLFIYFFWTLVVIESGQRMNKKVSRLFIQ